MLDHNVDTLAIKQMLEFFFGAALSFILLTFGKTIIEPLAQKGGQFAYQQIKDRYLQETLDRLDGKLVEVFDFFDDAILPQSITPQEKEILQELVLNEFSLKVWLDKTHF